MRDARSLFNQPHDGYRPTPLWWWSGDDVTEERIEWQLDRFVEGGILGAVVMNLAPAGPTYGYPPDSPAWFSEPWWDLFEFTCASARQRDMNIWFYDQIGFSGANIQGRVAGTEANMLGRNLEVSSFDAHAELREALSDGREVLSLYARNRPDTPWRRVTRDEVPEPSTSSPVQVVHARRTAFDYFNRQAVDRLIDHVHGEFERRVGQYFGDVIVGSFQDELPAMPTWSEAFVDFYAAQYGYDLLDVLPSLWDPSREFDQLRRDYNEYRTQLAEENFFKPLGDWHEQRGLLLGADQTNPARAGTPVQSTQLYGDYFATHRWYSAVGSDHEGDARVHSSMADLYGHERVWIESFHSSGWGGTLEETWDWLIPFFRSGATLYNPHASYYDTRAGWFEWAPPSTDFRQPYYAAYKEFSNAVARVSALMTWGDHDVDIAVLYPTSSVSCALPPGLPIDYFGSFELGEPFAKLDACQTSYRRIVGENNWFRSSPGLLDQNGLDFDILDEDSLAKGCVSEEGRLACGSVTFRTVVIPAHAELNEGVASRLLELLEHGGRILLAEDVPGVDSPDYGPLAQRVRDHERSRIVPVDRVPEAILDEPLGAWSEHGARVRRAGNEAVAFVPFAFPNATSYPLRKMQDSLTWSDIDFSADRYDDSTVLVVLGDVASAEVWNPATGEQCSARISKDGNCSRIEVAGDGAPAVLVWWSERTGTEPTSGSADEILAPARFAERHLEMQPVQLNEGWSQELVPTHRNEWGDFARPAGRTVDALEIWRMRVQDRDGTAREVRAGFGEVVRVLGPFAHEAAPAALAPDETRAIVAGVEDLDDGAPNLFSRSRGIQTDHAQRYSPNGMVREEFIEHPSPSRGERVALRTAVAVDQPGKLVLHVGSVHPRRVFVNGEEQRVEGTGFGTTTPLNLSAPVCLLEIHLEGSDGSGATEEFSRAWFTFARPGQLHPRPEFIVPADPTGRQQVLGTEFDTSENIDDATIVVGSVEAVEIHLDGRIVAKQEKVEYYDGGLGEMPYYFVHRIGQITTGRHRLELVCPENDRAVAVLADLAGEGASSQLRVVSGASWRHGGNAVPVLLRRDMGEGLAHTHAVRRPHPLKEAGWLHEGPEDGSVLNFSASDQTGGGPQWFEIDVPAGTAEIRLPARVSEIECEGSEVVFTSGVYRFQPPTSVPRAIRVRVETEPFARNGSAWSGPASVRTLPASAPMVGDWMHRNLGEWSGAVRFRRSIITDTHDSMFLDLGSVRGAVAVQLDDDPARIRFCAPFRFELGPVDAGEHELTVTVYGTLGPWLRSVSPTPHIPKSQLSGGVFGPVTLAF